MENYSISFAIDFETKTIAGNTTCHTEKIVSRNFKDFDIVEETTNYFLKIFQKSNFRHIQITACIEKDYSTIESVNRLCRDYSNENCQLIVWHNNGYATDIFEDQKLTKKYIREWYLEIVSRLYTNYIYNPAIQ